MTFTIARKLKEQFVKHHHANWAMMDQAIVSGSNFLMGILLARILGIAEFGVYSLAMLVVLFANMVQQSAINAPMMSIGPKQEKENEVGYYGGVVIQAILFALLSAVLTYIGVQLLSHYAEGWNILALSLPLSINVFLVQLQDFLRRYFFVVNKAKLSFISDTIRYLGYLIILALYLFNSSALSTEKAFWFSSLTALMSLLYILPQLRVLSFSFTSFKHCLKRHWDFSKWLSASALLQWFSGNIFTIVAGGMLGASAVGALKAAQSLLGITHIVFLALENFVPMKVAKLYHEGKLKEMKRYLMNTAAVGMSIVLLVAGVFTLFADFWFGLLFGEDFLHYSYLMGWVSVFYIGMAIMLPIRFALRAMEETKVLFWIYCFIALLSVTTVHWVINQWGVVGVPAASIVVQIILIAVTSIVLRIKLKQHLSNLNG